MTGPVGKSFCALLSHALERQVAGFGRPGCPDDLRGLSTYQTCNLLTGMFDRTASVLAK
ncbi:Ribonucleotide reductase beta subunit [Pseudomonas syringae pv. actinidiae]|uniref:Ribonucleotide reductase beta subunit n=1 Tax=Pseudomonas syringae pv. actinidiae TaxID=103796 RepID=A0A2V0QJH0_PSESF|nr:Ribonucleotide reductase beta subunit [Pseudomonas syringae pv. actinidiae]GBH17016.1 Ribonucleotide reductase beta subunit [Pseudomonas syringae pv. actinidiae]